MKPENRNYRKDDEKPKNDLIGLVLIVVGFICLGILFYFIQQPKSNTDETISIHKYNALQLRVNYLFMENQVKNQLLYDLAVDGKTDTAFVLSVINHVNLDFLLNPTETRKVDDDVKKELKELMAFQLDSICADWYESIPFMFMDAEHDSTWVLNSESYARSMVLVNELRNKWEK